MTVQFRGKLPNHVAIIMDGNGRWARHRSRPRVFGHRSGAKRVREVVETAGNLGIKVLTLYAFSEENWNRPVDEVNTLFSLLTKYLRQEVDKLHENNVRLRSIGNHHKLPVECQRVLQHAEEKTRNNDGLQLVLALSYSGRSDLTQAFQKLANLVKEGDIDPSSVDETTVRSLLSTADLPDPDLLIRTSGEQRVSNFLLWEMAYTEFFFTDRHWPEFTRADFLEAIEAYGGRDRRFGRIKLEAVPIVNQRSAES
ncbi:MAG: isoprenyl transferase [Oligoflexus sp.]